MKPNMNTGDNFVAVAKTSLNLSLKTDPLTAQERMQRYMSGFCFHISDLKPNIYRYSCANPDRPGFHAEIKTIFGPVMDQT